MGVVDYGESDSENETVTEKTSTAGPQESSHTPFPSRPTASRFVDASVPTFERKPKTGSVDVEKLAAPFEFGDRGHTWRQIKLKAYAEQFPGGMRALGAIANADYPSVGSRDRFQESQKKLLLQHFASVWDLAYVMLESEYLRAPANDTVAVLQRRDALLEQRWSR